MRSSMPHQSIIIVGSEPSLRQTHDSGARLVLREALSAFSTHTISKGRNFERNMMCVLYWRTMMLMRKSSRRSCPRHNKPAY